MVNGEMSETRETGAIPLGHGPTAPSPTGNSSVKHRGVELPASRQQQLEFVYKSLEDNQNTIRFLDAKTAFAVALLSAMAEKILSSLGNYLPHGGQAIWRLSLFLGFASALFLAGIIAVRIIFPSSNPSANCRFSSVFKPPFFLCEMNPRRFGRIFTSNPAFSRLAQDHEEYLNQVRSADSDALLNVLCAEVLKVSYIRQIKADRLKALAHATATCVFLFIVLLVTNAMVPSISKPLGAQIQGPVLLSPPPAASTGPAAVAGRQGTLTTPTSQSTSRTVQH
jgi:hypothetical protein